MTRLLAVAALAAVTLGLWPGASAAAPREKKGGRTTIAIDKRWEFRQAGTDAWRPATVPGSVHSDLLANRMISDPFFRDDEQKLQWIGKTGWEYRTTFDADAALVARDRVELVFDGLDTYATVTLNDTKLLDADNMFRTYRVDAKPAIKAGANALVVRFRSPIDEVLPKVKERGYELPASNDQGEKTSPYTRKAPYQYGWDWGPRFVTSGVWRPVRLEAWDTARITDVHVVQDALSTDAAKLTARVAVTAARAGEAKVTIDFADGPAGTSITPVTRSVALVAGENVVEVPVAIGSPKLWWPNGLGDQPLYTFHVSLDADGATDVATRRIGLRTIEVRRKPDEWGKSFEFVVNGVPVFMKGGNWIPADSFPERVTTERYRDLVGSCARANMNMLRVWGGGYYEDDRFYDACDEMGILVWQDFMFACSMYPADDAFLESVRREAIDNVTRLRDHPSIAIWVGNNEIETAWWHWGWKDKLPASLWDDYKKIFHDVLPKVCAELDPSRLYWPSSPSSNLEEDADSQRNGDVHYWQVWHASAPFSEYEKQFPRFMSEYGFQSFPLKDTVATYTTPDDWNIESPVMKAHQRHPRGNALIREYMLREYPEPKDFDSFLYVSQVLQADGIRIGAEHFRRSMPRTMGSLFWQVDDCWPVASWSSMDYYGRWKALQYASRRFYADVLLSAHEENGALALTGVSDRRTATKAHLRVRVLDVAGKTLSDKTTDVELAPLSSRDLATVPVAELLGGADPTRTYVVADLTADGKVLSTSRHFFRPFKELALAAPKVTTDVGGTKGDLKVKVTASALARAVYLRIDGVDAKFDDNFFDVDPGETVVVRVSAPGVEPSDARNRLRVVSLVDAFPRPTP